MAIKLTLALWQTYSCAFSYFLIRCWLTGQRVQKWAKIARHECTCWVEFKHWHGCGFICIYCYFTDVVGSRDIYVKKTEYSWITADTFLRRWKGTPIHPWYGYLCLFRWEWTFGETKNNSHFTLKMSTFGDVHCNLHLLHSRNMMCRGWCGAEKEH